MTTLSTRGLSAGSLFKVLYIGLFFPLLFFGVGCGIASYTGHTTVTFNGQNVYGVQGLVVGTVLGLVMPIIMAALMWIVMVISTRIWTLFARINLTVKD